MPARKGGRPRKGQIGKKAQIEKMVESAKKTSSTSTSPQPAPGKQGIGKEKNNSRGAVPLKVASVAVIQKQPARTTIIRLPFQGTTTSAKTKPIIHTQPSSLTFAVPKPLNNPNSIIVRLPPKQPPRNRVTFLNLPSEIRNVIYEHAMPRRKYCIQWIPRKDQRPTELTYAMKIGTGLLGPCLTAEEGLRRRDYDLPNPWKNDAVSLAFCHPPGPAALLLVNKRINQDTTPMFYGRNTFSFKAMRPMSKFLNTLRHDTRSMIRSLEIIHQTAGEPDKLKDRIWKERNDECWDNLCCQVRDQCDQLNSLTIDLTIMDIPFLLGPRAMWMAPLYYFCDLECLKHLNLRLHQSFTEDTVLEVEAYTIRKNLMARKNYYEPFPTSANELIGKKPTPVRVRTLRLTDSLQRPALRKTASREPGATKSWTPPPKRVELPRHPFDPGGKNKINGLGPWRGDVCR
ncbi:MAG: hypothetical protein Q9201_002897 [Fulgogasparrea decipioides]